MLLSLVQTALEVMSVSQRDFPVIVFSVLVTHFKENIQPGLRDLKFSNQEIVKMKAPCKHLGEGKGRNRENINRSFLFIFDCTSCPLTNYILSHASLKREVE